jgi:UDPglucose 6-dehydrogenase
MQIVVIGVGYVGLVTGTCFAEMGHHVVCLDIDESKIEQLKKGEIPIYEPGLQEMVLRNQKSGRLSFTSSYQEGMQGARVAFIAVDTPPLPDGQADRSRVFGVAKSIGLTMKEELLIVTKSTVPPGTTHEIRRIIEEQGKGIPFAVASNPEFLKEGSALADCLKPDRVIVGVEKEEDGYLLHKLFAPFMLSHDRFIVMDILSAELTKYAANSMLATRISFMNELSRLAEILGADIQQIRKGIGSDKRIGHAFLYPGIGYGGSCLPKDVKALVAQARALNSPLSLLEQVDAVNQSQIEWFINSLLQALADIEQPVIAVWGLAFKPDTDDLREAPALTAIKRLLANKANLRLFDPIAMDRAKQILPDNPFLTYCSSELEAAFGADAILLVTEWKQFRFIDMEEVKTKMRGHLFFDGRNQYAPEEMAKMGFYYKSIGQPVIESHALRTDSSKTS